MGMHAASKGWSFTAHAPHNMAQREYGFRKKACINMKMEGRSQIAVRVRANSVLE